MTGAFLSILLLMVARHHPPSRRKIKEIWHGRVSWERESNTAMLRSGFSQTDNEKEAKPTEKTKPTEEATTATPFEKQNIVIVIPYRDRAVHYKKIMEHLPSITREKWSIHTILVEQYDKDPFRRAWLLNIGISEAKKRFKDDNTCVVTHDVDMIADSKVDYSWCDRPTQICSELSCFNGGVPYATSGGGVVQASLKDWYTINGFTNSAKGWGGEDDDMHHRFRVNNLLSGGHLRRPKKGSGKCHCMHDEHHTKRVRDPTAYGEILSKIKRMKSGSNEWKTDGLNSLKYYISSEVVDKYGTIHLKVEQSAGPQMKDKMPIDGKKKVEISTDDKLPQRVCVNKLTGAMWNAFASIINILNNLNADYAISDGTVLSWYRDCSLGNTDLDVTINYDWLQANLGKLHSSFVNHNWEKKQTILKPIDMGYEESWEKNGVKLDIFSLAKVGRSHFIQGLTVSGKTYPCKSFFQKYERHEWNGVYFNVPAPIEPYLKAKYGVWRVKKKYTWNISPFEKKDGQDRCSTAPLPETLECCTPSNKRCVHVQENNYILPTCEKNNLVQMLSWLKNTLSENVVWYITAGTLLGSIRNQMHIPFETDIDIVISENSLETALQNIRDNIDSTHFKLIPKTTPARLFFSEKNQIHIDIWTSKTPSDDIVIEYMPVHGIYNWYEMCSDLIFPLKTCIYESEEYPCPAQSEEWVRKRFGPDWKIPRRKYGRNKEYKDGDASTFTRTSAPCQGKKPSETEKNTFETKQGSTTFEKKRLLNLDKFREEIYPHVSKNTIECMGNHISKFPEVLKQWEETPGNFIVSKSLEENPVEFTRERREELGYFDLEKRQQDLRILAKSVFNILNSLGIPYIAHAGLALGLVRNNDLLFSDNDIDIAILTDDVDFVNFHMGKMLAREGHLLSYDFSCGSPRLFKVYKDGQRFKKVACRKCYNFESPPHADIFIYKATSDKNMAQQRGVKWCPAISGRPPIKIEWFNKEGRECDMWEGTEGVLKGLQIRLPCNVVDYLDNWYGRDWRTPVNTKFVEKASKSWCELYT